MTKIDGTKFVCRLPASGYAWTLQAIGDAIIAINQGHPPVVIERAKYAEENKQP